MSDKHIGILFNSSMWKHIIDGKTRQESIPLYEEAAAQHGVTLCYFRLEDLKLRSMEVNALVRGREGYVRRTIPIPRVIHNRGMYFHAAAHAKVQQLADANIRLFNQVNRYGKMKIHNLLNQDPNIVPHLPETSIASPRVIAEMMTRYDSLILKPDNSSVGKGIMKLTTTASGWSTTYKALTKGAKRWCTIETSRGVLPKVVTSALAQRHYLAQQYLPLATYGQRPFDLRVSVQRNGTGQWQITGIVGKIAAGHTFVTNVAQGGTVMRFEQLIAATFPPNVAATLHQRVSQFGMRVVQRLSSHLPQLADVGLDIGLSTDGSPLFIECNGRDQRYSFREANLMDTWKATYANPIAYGAWLLRHSSTPSIQSPLPATH
ncbi:YheC/YheD family endospore coat-associated protein [Paenibacillus sp. 481]|uniref:YheC/YheD family endospore coat-associated protein n=1 Tax=Paenibacillus sp. 481 TaxID=2835869 RepID=UPI001E55980E|nr:YheC/YheD family protein [Paenibacillus sp. 481]UHA74529.1 YheC/YheD family protein [Paenibacillus sp. 481]